MKNFTYYQICYINPVTKRKYKTNYIFENPKDAEFFVDVVLKDSKDHFKYFVKETNVYYYTSLIDLMETNKADTPKEK